MTAAGLIVEALNRLFIDRLSRNEGCPSLMGDKPSWGNVERITGIREAAGNEEKKGGSDEAF